MRKNRNSFFAESNYQAYNPNMNPNMNMGGAMGATMGAPYQAASNYFYQGPMPNNYNTQPNGNDIESRLAKIERQLNRMDYRLSKLENTNTTIISSDDIETNNTNMYML